MIEIGTRVRYDEKNVALDDCAGIVVEPTAEEAADMLRWLDGSVPPAVMVEWDDGARHWEILEQLVEVAQS